MDTIDVSNLNRQFLFQKQHVGLSKAVVARDAVLRYAPDASIVAHHANVMAPEYGTAYVGQFNLVLNALDNLPARRHMNRVCLAAGVPLIDSGTQGWLGQVQSFVSPRTSCFDCDEHPTPTTFPVCTIRSKPSKPIHCIHWAKILFSRLFGKADAEGTVLDLDKDEGAEDKKNDTDRSDAPTSADPELQRLLAEEAVTLNRLRTSETFAEYVFHKIFHTDVVSLASMKHMWEDRPAPIALVFDEVRAGKVPAGLANADEEQTEGLLADQCVWTLDECVEKFASVTQALNELKNAKGGLDWDKDEELHLDFVTAASNIRSSQFAISRQSRFTVKSAAGNIIPAIATTNAIISGLIVTEALKILRGGDYLGSLRYTYLQKTPSNKRILLLAEPEKQNPSCYVCGSNFVEVSLDTGAMTVGAFASEILQKHLNLLSPSVMVDSNIVFEGGEMLEDWGHQVQKPLTAVGISAGSIVRVSDMSAGSNLTVDISIMHKATEEFETQLAHPFSLKGTVRAPPAPETKNVSEEPEDSDDDFVVVVDPKNLNGGESSETRGTKRKHPDGEDNGTAEPAAKRTKTDARREDSDVMLIE